MEEEGLEARGPAEQADEEEREYGEEGVAREYVARRDKGQADAHEKRGHHLVGVS